MILRSGSTLLVVLGVVAGLLVGGCGGSDDTTSAAPLASSVAPGLQTTRDDGPSRFCEQLTHLDEGIKLPPGVPTLGTKGSYLRQDSLRMRSVSPPPEIAGAWHIAETLSGKVGSLIGKYDITDPDQARELADRLNLMQGQLSELDAANQQIRTYEQQECSVSDTPARPNTTPTSEAKPTEIQGP